MSSFDRVKEIYDTIADSSISMLNSVGILLKSAPPGNEVPPSPRDLSIMPDTELGDLYDTFIAWRSYLIEREIDMTALVRQHKAYLDALLVQIKYRQLDTKLPKGEREELVQLDDVFATVQARYLKHQTVLDGIRLSVRRLSGNVSQISRHVTLRDFQKGIIRRQKNLGYGPDEGDD